LLTHKFAERLLVRHGLCFWRVGELVLGQSTKHPAISR